MFIGAPIGLALALTPALGLNYAYTSLADSGAERFAVLSVSFATLGWLATSWVTRSISRRQHTVNVLLQHRFSAEMSTYMTSILARYPIGSQIDAGEAGKLVAAEKSTGAERVTDHTADTDAARKSVCDAIDRVLNYYEFLAIGIKKGDLDAAVMKDFYRGMLTGLAEHCHGLVSLYRQENDRVYENLVDLYFAWTIATRFPKELAKPDDAAPAANGRVEANETGSKPNHGDTG